LVALYGDFENLHAGLVEARFGEGYYGRPDNSFKPQEALIDQAIVKVTREERPLLAGTARSRRWPTAVAQQTGDHAE
jgi:hypothetical protein